MSRWQRRCAVFVAAEVVLAAVIVGHLATRARIPAVKLDHVDEEVVAAIAWHQRWMNLSSGDDWQSLAKLYLAYGCLPQAEICCGEAIKLAPESKTGFYLWAVVLERLGRLADAEQKLTRAIELGAVEAESWVRLGRIRLRQDSAQGAEQAFRRALRRNPDDLVAAIGLTRILLRADRPRQAAETIRPFVEKAPRAHAPCQFLSLAEAALGHPELAERWTAKAEWRPDVARYVDPRIDVEGWAAKYGALRWGTEARAAADPQSAVMLMERTLQLGWDDHFAAETAIAYLQLKRPHEALSTLRRLIGAAGKSSFALGLEGEAHAQLGERRIAQGLWRESLELRGSRAAHERLAETEPRPEQARHHQSRALYFAAIERLEAGEVEETARLFEASLELDPSQSDARYLLGEARREQGHADAAPSTRRRQQ